MRLLCPDIDLQHYDLENGCCIDLSVKGVGGGGGSDTGIIGTVMTISIYPCISSLISVSFTQRVILRFWMSVFRVGNMQTYTAVNVSHLGVHLVTNSGISIRREDIIKQRYVFIYMTVIYLFLGALN